MATKVILNFLVVSFLIEGGCYANEINESDEIHEKLDVDEGSNLTLKCPGETPLGTVVEWIRESRNEHMTTREDGTLQLINLKRHDSGIYKCDIIDSTSDDQMQKHKKILLEVKSHPPPLVNVTVHPSTILALLRWDVEDNGGYPITHFTAKYRLAHSPPGQPPDPWHPVLPPRIDPSATQIDVYRLEPNSTYQFQVWANNKLGEGEAVILEACTQHDVQEIELGHLLEGAQTFDTRIWVAAVAVVMGTLVVLALGTCYALYSECHIPLSKRSTYYLSVPLLHSDDQEILELVPNIILNPGYHDDTHIEWREPDENSNDTTSIRLNNNTVIRPFRV
ncbi:protein sidekick-1 isoform X2 [Lycorma delicatula]|uniref:protein sidekick-1 isoform X2 n=1 Tax=Lycorma delicatula TaxID=130591 RepID=UPI003F50D86D